jgi:hypothetical protein
MIPILIKGVVMKAIFDRVLKVLKKPAVAYIGALLIAGLGAAFGLSNEDVRNAICKTDMPNIEAHKEVGP